MKNFRFVTLDGTREIGLSCEEAHDMLKAFAKLHDLDLHIHPSGWEGNTLSSAFVKGGDPLTDTIAVVRKGDL